MLETRVPFVAGHLLRQEFSSRWKKPSSRFCRDKLQWCTGIHSHPMVIRKWGTTLAVLIGTAALLQRGMQFHAEGVVFE